MGNSLSGTPRPPAYHRLDQAIPPMKDCGWDNNYNWVDRGIKPFKNDREREEFLFALITVLTSNGTVDMQKSDFRMVFARRQPDPAAQIQPSSAFTWSKKPSDRIFASLVSIDEHARIKSKIEPTFGGKDQAEAFQLFKKHVEVMLDKVMVDVANISATGPATSLQRGNQRGDQIVDQQNPSQSEWEVNSNEVPMGVLFDMAPPSYEKSQKLTPTTD